MSARAGNYADFGRICQSREGRPGAIGPVARSFGAMVTSCMIAAFMESFRDMPP